MTVYRLHKLLTKLIAEGHKRMTVCIDKSKVTHPLESEGVRIIPTTGATIDTHEMMDEDGGTATRKDGQTIYRTALIITAEC